MRKKLLLIGWDAADWKSIDRLVDQGDVPMMKGLIGSPGSTGPSKHGRAAPPDRCRYR